MTTKELRAILSIDESYRIERTVSTSNMDKFQEANHVRQQLFDNLQPILQPNLQPNLQDVEDKYKRLIFSIDIYLIDAKDLLTRYLSCNHLATILQPNLQPNLQPSSNHSVTLSRQAFSKSVLRPAIKKGYVKMQYPDKPNSKNQKYQLTDIGVQILQALYDQENNTPS